MDRLYTRPEEEDNAGKRNDFNAEERKGRRKHESGTGIS
jgi:hypothetical protein